MTAPAGTPRLALRGISKRYPGVLANDNVSLSVAPGEIHGLIGENGAGKSTLMKIVYGAVRPDAGEVLWDGAPLPAHSPAQARRAGIGMVFQHFSLFDTLTVAENVLLALPGVTDRAGLARDIEAMGEHYGLPVNAAQHVYSLSVGERQRVEIIRCLLQKPRLLIMDEPTSVLTPQAVERLFATLRQLASEGVSILYISHKLEEVRALCSRATVLRGGRVTGTCDPRQESVASLSRMMIGAEPPRATGAARQPGAALLEIDRLTMPPLERTGKALDAVSLTVRAGEVVGIAGVSGNGQGELLALISGEDRRAPPQSVRLAGAPVGGSGVVARRAHGLAFVPEERLGRGAVPVLGLHLNTLLTHDAGLTRGGLISASAIVALAASIIARFDVRTAGPTAAAKSLSGGNLQKFIVGREVVKQPRVFVVAQPTWGVDVGAAARIRQELVALADAGSAVLVVSEELDELFEICDALHVIAGGRLSARIPVAQASVERIGALMGGGAETEGAHA
ncbi:MAG: ABC transporter ATP-binding protein [Burkholderiales bacterium]|nr:ABC transporter ATP-binding protein [Burkholderiales bacterium]